MPEFRGPTRPCQRTTPHRTHFYATPARLVRCLGIEAPATADLAEVLLAQPREAWRSVPAPLHIRLGR